MLGRGLEVTVTLPPALGLMSYGSWIMLLGHGGTWFTGTKGGTSHSILLPYKGLCNAWLPGPGCLFGTYFLSAPRSYFIHSLPFIQCPESRTISVSVRLGNWRRWSINGNTANFFPLHMAWPGAQASWFLPLDILHLKNLRFSVPKWNDYLDPFTLGKGKWR